MRLAHPQRCGAAIDDDFPGWERVFGDYTWSEMRRVFADTSLLTPAALQLLVNDPRNRKLAEFTSLAAYSENSAGTEMGSAFATIIYLRQLLHPQPQFLIEDELLQLLEQTDIADDIPISMLQLPYPRCYIEFGRSRTTAERVPNVETGLHVLEGVYVESGEHHTHGPGVYAIFTGSPLGRDHALDDATDSIFLPTSDPDRTLKAALEWAYARSQEVAKALNLRQSPHEYLEPSFSCLKLLLKVLLYLGLPEARKTLRAERAEFKRQVDAKKNPAKRAKAEKQMRMLSDYILVSAPPPRTENLTEHAGHTVKAHWRRGHYRLQAHGPQYSLRKVLFIQPVLVGSLAAGEAKPAPQYVVR